MAATKFPHEVPTRGAALLVIPKGTPDQIAKIVCLAITGYGELLRRKPETFIYLLDHEPRAVVFLEPVPQMIVDLLVELLGAETKSVRLEALTDAYPVFRLSPAGIRLYASSPEGLGPFVH